jgi:hypothetical protein
VAEHRQTSIVEEAEDVEEVQEVEEVKERVVGGDRVPEWKCRVQEI